MLRETLGKLPDLPHAFATGLRLFRMAPAATGLQWYRRAGLAINISLILIVCHVPGRGLLATTASCPPTLPTPAGTPPAAAPPAAPCTAQQIAELSLLDAAGVIDLPLVQLNLQLLDSQRFDGGRILDIYHLGRGLLGRGLRCCRRCSLGSFLFDRRGLGRFGFGSHR